jgi:Mce-associated membrane protein
MTVTTSDSAEPHNDISAAEPTTAAPDDQQTVDSAITPETQPDISAETVDEKPAPEPPRQEQAGSDNTPDPTAESAPETRPSWWMPVTVALSVLAIALAVTGVLGAYRAISGLVTEHGRNSALTAGRTTAISLLSFDYETANQDLTRLKAMTTPDFANGFVRDNTAFLQIIAQGKVKMTSQATEAGVKSYDGQAAHVLVSVKSQLSNAQQPQAMERNYRMDISLVRQQGRWLANGIQFIS